MIYNTIQHEIRNRANLSLTDWCLLESIYQLSVSPKSKYKTWCYASKSSFKYLASPRTIVNRMNLLEKNGWLEFKDEKRLLKRTTKKYYNEITAYVLGVKKLHTPHAIVAPHPMQELHTPHAEVAPNNNIDNNTIDNNKDSSVCKKEKHTQEESKISTLEKRILQLEAEKKKKEKNSAKKENHEFPDITARKTYKVKVSKYNPCLTSASGGREVNQHWQDSKKLKGDYKASRGIDVEIGIIEAAKISFIEKGFNYNRYINTFEKLENAIFAWIDNQQKGFNVEPKKLSNPDFNEDGTPSYMMGLQ